jgi:hypothetical protein
MDLEEIVWGYIPIIIGLIEIIYSGISLNKKRIISRLVTFLIILTLNILAIYILIQMIIGAWPTFLPHIIILISTLILIIQKIIRFKNRNKTFANTS